MVEAVAKVARIINATVEEGKDCLELDVHCNVLTKLPNSVAEVEHLKIIDLANNKFSVFPEKLLEIATLETINLEGNSLTVSSEPFMSPTNTSRDALTRFHPTEIPVERLCAMPALKSINVKSNPLDEHTLTALRTPHTCEILFTADA
ncbi:hypothetical protein NHX12_025247 [Muraenolepis orangiensis]|uniref:Leucine-rich repeat protein SHOC-2 n=1 Tax=Muraenolepis orangiensis TaxID=630683 RepID=A0A9Q0EHW5_9TELE|nr:hypothetical protein NHX12_025247 [Muraenolepis orangiensis]